MSYLKKRKGSPMKAAARKRKTSETPASCKVFNTAEIGSLLRARRKELGYTQEDIAELMRFSPRLVGEIERGRETVGIQKVLNYALNLGIDITLTVRGKAQPKQCNDNRSSAIVVEARCEKENHERETLRFS